MPTKITPLRLTPEDLAALDEAVDILGAESRSDAIRTMIRTVVEAAGARPKKKAKKKPAGKKRA